jgi:ketosteroid isomerase-like protein
VPAALATLDAEVEWLSPGPPAELPWAATLRGRDQVAGWLAKVRELAEFEQFLPQGLCAGGDTVMAQVHERFRIRATGRTVENDMVHVFTLRGGKIIRFREYYDTATVAAAFRAA